MSLLLIATQVAAAIALSGLSHPARIQPFASGMVTVTRVTRERAVVRRAGNSNLDPRVSYAGTVSTIQGFKALAASATFDIDDGMFYILDYGDLDRIETNGHIKRLAHLPNYGSNLVWDHATQCFYVTVPQSYEILSISPNGVSSVLAGGTFGHSDGKGRQAQFETPTGIALDPQHGWLYVADSDRLRRVATDGTVITVGPVGFIGIGYGQSLALAFDTKSGEVAVVDPPADVIWAFTPILESYKLLAGRCVLGFLNEPGCAALQMDGRGKEALFATPVDIAYSSAADDFFVVDSDNNQIRRVSPSGRVTTLAGGGEPGIVDGVGQGAEFLFPNCAADDPVSRSILVCDGYSRDLRLVTITGQTAPLPPHSFAMQTTPTFPAGPSNIVRAADGSLWFDETTANYIAQRAASGEIAEFALPGGFQAPYGLAIGADGAPWFADVHAPIDGHYGHAYIARFNSRGSVTEIQFPDHCAPYAPSQPNFFTPGKDGDLWFGATCPSSIGFVSPSHSLTQYVTETVGGIAFGLGSYVWVGGPYALDKYLTNGALVASYTNVTSDAGIAIGSDGNIWFLSNANDLVGSFDPATLLVKTYALPPCQCYTKNLGNLTAGPDGEIWFTEGSLFDSVYPGAVDSVTTSGIVTQYLVNEPRSVPSGLTFDSAGTLWITDVGAEKIGYMR
jgi:virginiamycin B lyase